MSKLFKPLNRSLIISTFDRYTAVRRSFCRQSGQKEKVVRVTMATTEKRQNTLETHTSTSVKAERQSKQREAKVWTHELHFHVEEKDEEDATKKLMMTNN